MKHLIGLLALLLIAGVAPAQRGGHGGSSGSHHSSPRHAPATPSSSHLKTHSAAPHLSSSGKTSGSRAPAATKYSSHYAHSTPGIARDSRGRIERSSAATHAFKKQTGYPNGRPGYVIDHIVPLSRGGADSPSNMQWQTVSEAKAKDKWERGPR